MKFVTKFVSVKKQIVQNILTNETHIWSSLRDTLKRFKDSIVNKFVRFNIVSCIIKSCILIYLKINLFSKLICNTLNYRK